MAVAARASITASEQAPAGLRRLVLGALGIVYGDIGTSPLYTMRETFGEAGGLVPLETTVLSALSFIFWSLIIIVTVKYVWLILRADNRGEGGVLAVSALALRSVADQRRGHAAVVVLSILGLSLFFGDGLITPAISVLSAVEGLKVVSPELTHYVLPISLAVLFLLFLLQQRGTELVGRLFGPVMLAWFTILALLGLAEIINNPTVLRAIDPRWALALAVNQPWHTFVALGAIVLCFTGAEALYADMGHFGRRPIRVAWLGLVLPALVINYYGQGALVLRDIDSLTNPFYLLAPSWMRIPLVLLATAATIIASQAVISGVFSLTRQAIQLGYLPRMAVRHTSATEIGQIYIPRMNWILLAGVAGLVLGFGSSSSLAAAYGVTVTGEMAIVTVLAGIAAAKLWDWGVVRAGLVFGTLFVVELTFFFANILKIPQGGWFPLIIAAAVSFIIVTWRRGRRVLWDKLYAGTLSLSSFIDKIDGAPQRVPGTSVFMTGNPDVVPNALLHNLKHNRVLHERVIIMRVTTLDVPWVPDGERLRVAPLEQGFFRLDVQYGFMDRPDVPKALELAGGHGLKVDLMRTSFFFGRETLIPSSHPDMSQAQERLFILLANSALSATAYFCIPPDRVVEMGTQVEI